MHTCLVIPHYDHLEQFKPVLPQLAGTGLPLIVVDDASPEPVFMALKRLITESGFDVTLYRHEQNLGKGGAVTTGLRLATEKGYTHALQIDADGQHDIDCLGELLAMSEQHPDALVCGAPVFDETISAMRKYGRVLTNGLCRIEALSFSIVDAMCGFRCYPLAQVEPLLTGTKLPQKMGFDPEILVRSSWSGIKLCFVPVQVKYPKEGRSHFRYLGDNLEITWMHTRLLLGMLVRAPQIFIRRVRGG